MLRLFRRVFFFLLLASTAAFAQLPPNVKDTQPGQDRPPTPLQSLEKFTVPEGFQVTLFAGEPDVYQPIAMEFDDRGRLWVIENFSYPDWASKNQDRILIFEDIDNDGRFDSRKVFADNLSNLTGMALGFGGVWCCSTPNFVFIPDRDGDDRPDGPPEIKLDGWNDDSKSVRHNVFNGMTWGPDGWMYGSHGILADSLVGKPGTDVQERVRLNCGIWRYHPISENFQVVAHGTTNPWGIDFNEYGHGFFTNCVIGHLWHLIPQARYERMYGSHFHPHAYRLIDACSDHLHWGGGAWTDSRGGKGMHSEAGGGHAHVGTMIYQGGLWPREYHGALLTANLHGNRLNRDTLHQQGSGYVARHASDFMMANDPWFRGIDIKCGPDGNVFVSDWTDLGECHDNDGTHRSSGRIYKISYGKSEASMSEAPNLAALSNFELLELIDHKNSWYWSHALRILHERSESGSDMGALSAELRRQWQAHASSPTTRKLRLLSAQKLTKTMTTADLHFLLDDTNEQVQSWAIRELAERNLTNNIESARRLHSVSKDASPIVQLAIASSIHHTDPSRPIYHQIVASLMRKMPSDDQNLPMMIWSAAERMAETNTEFVELLQIAANNEAVHDIRTYIARRFIVDHANDSVRLEQLTDHASRLAQSNKQAAVAVLRGMMQGLRAQRKLKRPSNWDQVAKNINSPIAEELSLKFGDKSVISRLRSNASDTSLNPSVRRSAIRMLSDNRIVGTRDLLIKLINDRAIRRFAIESLDNFNSSDVSQALVDNFDTFRPAEQRAAIATLTSSRQHAAVLLTAIAKEQIAANAIKPANAMTIYQLKDSGLRRQLKELWGDIRSTPRELKQNIADWKAVLSPEVLALADLAKGQKLYMENCGKCHRLFGEGVAIGPDLTGSDRKNLDYVLENVVTPSAVVGKDYRTSTIRLNDGRSISGSLRQQTRQTVVVQTIDGQITLNRDDIEAIDASNLSLMPEGQFDVLTKDQVRDLIGYLRSN